MDMTALARFGILLVRPGAIMLLAPGLGGRAVPAPARVGLTVLLALALAPSITVPAGPDVGVASVVLRELLIGIALGLTARALVAGVEFGGHLASQQIGFSYAATIDPEGGARNTMLATLFGMIATFTWLALDGHHLLVRALHASYAGLPIGAGGVNGSLLVAVREIFALVFITAVRLSAPIIAVLLIVEIALGLISRTAPALNFFVIGFPIRLVIGLVVLAATVSTIPAVTRSLLERVAEAGLAMAAAFR